MECSGSNYLVRFTFKYSLAIIIILEEFYADSNLNHCITSKLKAMKLKEEEPPSCFTRSFLRRVPEAPICPWRRGRQILCPGCVDRRDPARCRHFCGWCSVWGQGDLPSQAVAAALRLALHLFHAVSNWRTLFTHLLPPTGAMRFWGSLRPCPDTPSPEGEPVPTLSFHLILF